MSTQMSRRIVLQGMGAAAASAGLAFSAAPAAASTGRGADTVIMNGKVLTMTGGPRAEAVAIKNGVIVAVGDNRQIGRMAGRGAQVIDAAGGTVLPGINDGHLHFNGFGFSASNFGFEAPKTWTYDVNKPTVAEIIAVIAMAVAEADDPASWIRAGGWDGTRLDALPTRDLLDPVSGDHPVYMTDISYHAVAANSAALAAAGITRDTVPPTGGIIEKDANGEPTGILREAATGLVSAAVPPQSEEDIALAMQFGTSVLHSLGITSVTDPGVGLSTVDRYRRLHESGSLPLRMNLMLGGGTQTDAVRRILSDFRPLRGVDKRWLHVGQVKLNADGVPTDAKTSWLYEPYVDGTTSHLLTEGATDEERVATLRANIALAARSGFQVGTHATGDAAIDAVVAGYIATRTDRLRHYVIHGDLTPPSTLRLMAQHGFPVSFNPTIKQVYSRFFDLTLGPERVDYQWPFRSAIDAGVVASSASDAAVVTPDWLIGVAGAVTRRGFDGQVGGIEQAITIEEALHSYTTAPAYQDHAEKWKGRLRPGYVGDVTILDGDVLSARSAEEIVGLSVTGTVVGGKVVYDATSSAAPAARRGADKVAALKEHAAGHVHTQGVACCCQTAQKRAAEHGSNT